MNTWDIIIVAIYLIALFAWAIYIGLKETSEDFLILSRKAPFLLVLFSVVSTWVGTGTTVATAASGYDTGISLGLTAAVGGVFGVVIAALFTPQLKWFGDKYKAHTLGDFFSIRYSKTSHKLSSIFILIIYFLLTAAQFVGLTLLLEVWTGTEFHILIWVAAISTIIYTAFAGIKSDFYTDIIHFWIMFVVLFLILLPVTLTKIGGFQMLLNLPQTYFNPFEYGGVSFFIAGIFFGASSVFVTVELWQRVYASVTAKSAKYALLLSVFIIVFFYAISTFFGMSMKLLMPNLANRDIALFALMKNYLPVGFLGLGIAGFMAIFISTINSTIMVASATITKDFFISNSKLKLNERKILQFGRISTLICGFMGLIIAVIFPNLIALSVNSLFMLLILVPSIIGGFFWKKATEKGALYSIIAGLLVLLFLFFYKPEIAFVPAFLVSTITFILGSLFTNHNIDEDLNLVWGWRNK